MSADSNLQSSNAPEPEANAASAPAGSTPEAEVTPTVPNFRKGFMKDSQFEVLMGMGEEREYRQMMESLLEDLQGSVWRAIWWSRRAKRFGGCGAPSASVTAWRSRTSKVPGEDMAATVRSSQAFEAMEPFERLNKAREATIS